jgi:ribosomal protein L16 Arg81 hydroxylase
MQSIARIEAPDRATLLREYVDRQRPVVLTGAMKDWKALSRWTPEYLKSALPGQKVRAVALPTDTFDGYVEQKPDLKEFEFSDFVEAIHDRSSVGGRFYNLHSGLKGALSPLKEDTGLPPYLPPESLFDGLLIAGPQGYTVRAHYDVPNNFLAQITGRKRVVLFPPSELYRLYPFPAYTSGAAFAQVDVDKPDLKRFPRFRMDHAMETILEPGEMLYIPSCWWHQIHYLTTTIGMNFFYKVPLAKMLRLSVVRCAGVMLYRPELVSLLGLKKKQPASGQDQRPNA